MTREKYVPVRDVMTTNIEMIDGLTTVADALDKMRAKQISSLIIKRRDEFDEYGVLTVQDIAQEVLVADLAPERVNAYEIMKKPMVTVDANMNIRYTIRLLSRFSLSRVLVVENGEAVGLVTLRDLVLRFSGFQ